MNNSLSEIEIPLSNLQENLKLCIYGDKENTLIKLTDEEAAEWGESPYQLLEGNFYNYYFKIGDKSNHEFQLRKDENGIVSNSRRKDVSEGRIAPNIYVGSLSLDIVKSNKEKEPPILDTISVEVLATKFDNNPDISYRNNYQFMINDITQKCTELLLQINSPVQQHFEIDYLKDNKTIYQRYAFVQSLLNSSEFNDAVQKIISSPVTRWKEISEQKDIRGIRRFDNKVIRQIVSGTNRIKLSNPIGKLYDVPSKIETDHKIETVDTLENRFIKHALEVFLKFCTDCKDIFEKNKYNKSAKEAKALSEQLESNLNHPFFKDITRPNTLKLNSPALQRKSGYREVLNAWLQFDLAAKLLWKGGEDVYNAGKRDIAVLYEYWLFFVLYDLMKNKFDTKKSNGKNYSDLIEETKDGLNLMLKSGKFTALDCIYDTGKRKLNVRFSYNKSFTGNTKFEDKKEGSWTKTLRPDYTLSIWPMGFKDFEAEEKEEIVHIHFDSKYKVQHFTIERSVEKETVDNEDSENITIEKIEERKGIYKNIDLFKMHAYKDAIRRTGGAYILYPGTENIKPFKGFHELIPGLGAFAIKPNNGDNGTKALSDFIDEVISHFLNMASQQRRMSKKIYQVHEGEIIVVNEPIPEDIIPNETFVVVGYCKSDKHKEWIEKHMCYNGRTVTRGAMGLTPDYIGAKYLLIHDYSGDQKLYEIFQDKYNSPRVMSNDEYLFTDYPSPSQKNYLVFKIKECKTKFSRDVWDIRKLKNYTGEEHLPFTCTLTELLKS